MTECSEFFSKLRPLIERFYILPLILSLVGTVIFILQKVQYIYIENGNFVYYSEI